MILSVRCRGADHLARVLSDADLAAGALTPAGTIFPVDLTDKVDWSGEWKQPTGWLPERWRR
jgi:hypothetical protein